VAASYATTLGWLDGLEAARGMRLGLDRLFPVLELLGSPHKRLEVVHVAGTNGKGSSAAMLDAIYREAGFSTGLYTSPHLCSFTERIRVDGRAIGENAVVLGIDRVRGAMEASGAELTYFEIATVLALMEFVAAGVDLAIVEVGLGGRLDATNVVDGRVGLITSIGLDHGAELGTTFGAVAREKAGIMNAGMTVLAGRVASEALVELEAAAATAGARLRLLGRDFEVCDAARSVGLAGAHQVDNAALVCEAVRRGTVGGRVGQDAVRRGLTAVRWPARLETVSDAPRLILDSAHNPEGAAALSRALTDIAPHGPRVLVFGAMADKDWSAMLDHLVPLFDEAVLVRPDQHRAASPTLMKESFVAPGPATLVPVSAFDTAADGLSYAAERAGEKGTVVVAGSVFLAAELYELASGRSDPFAA
jgi:dihydrofolate synthase/folylpolyglutamate synthase